MIVCNGVFFLVFSQLCLVYFILLFFIVSRSDISAGNSLSVVPQYSAVPSCYTDVIFLFDMVFTEINADAATSCSILAHGRLTVIYSCKMFVLILVKRVRHQI